MSTEPTACAAASTRSSPIDQILRRSEALLRTLLETEAALPGGTQRDPQRLAEQLPLSLAEHGHSLDEVFERMACVLAATPSSASWRFVNQLFGGREPLALAAETLALWRNVSMYTFKAAGAQVLVENEVLSRMLGHAGFPAGEGMFTPGGSLANMAAMLLARDRADPSQRDQGASGRFAVYASEEAHYSLKKNAGFIGLGRRALRAVPVDRQGRMDPLHLAEMIKADRQQGLRPLMVVATAGSTVRGAFDAIDELAAIARPEGAWLHVDAALGGSVLLSPAQRHLLQGVKLADSISWNPHKMMGVPLQCSVLLLAQRGALARSLDECADYLFQADEDRLNPGHRSLQCGRRVDAFKLWATWQHLGDVGWAERVDRQFALATRAAELIDADPELALVEAPMSINVCFEVKGCPTEPLCERLDQQGSLKIGYGSVFGRPVLRLVCVNPELTESHLLALLEAIKAAAAPLRAAC
jgi:sulfinoalanine decarboxylase/sulfinoalanine decarboxylase/aspartate 1-decarboxylase